MGKTKNLRLGLVGLNQVPLDWKGNLARIEAAWEKGRQQGVQLFCYPELAISGYSCEDAFLHPDTAARSFAMVEMAGMLGLCPPK